MKTVLIALILVGFAAGGKFSWASDAVADRPILVELFTSEGCSSCPPADAWLQKVDAAQPVPGAHLIVLSEHVDYWDQGGWKDPYSSAVMTERQTDYVRALGLKTPYTPQIILNGAAELQLNNAQQAEQRFQQAMANPAVPVRITSATVDSKNPALVHANVEVDGKSESRNADVYEVVALAHADSQVLRGENSGKRLGYVAVVQNMTRIGKLEKGNSFSRTVEIKLKPGTDPKNVRLIFFAQESGFGKVVGAASQEGIN